MTNIELKKRLDLAFERMNDEDIKFILNRQVRWVKWLYNNSNKMTMVYDEKMVRLMIQKLQRRAEK